MSKCAIRDFMGDYALDIEPFNGCKITLYFNSLRNAETVKRCIEVDDSKPNAATAVDFVEVVRCKDCAYHKECNGVYLLCFKHRRLAGHNDFCNYGKVEKNESITDLTQNGQG